MEKAKKLTYEELFRSTTMFYINPRCETAIERMVNEQTANILKEINEITSKEKLKQYIKKQRDSLTFLTSVLEISEERFKRMVSMIRKDRGFVFSTEWELEKIRTEMLGSATMMDSILDLIWNGKDNPKLQASIPAFYLENMTMIEKKKQDISIVHQQVKRSLEGTYSNMIGDAILNDIEEELKKVCINYGLNYLKNKRVPKLDRTVSFVLEDEKTPKILLDVSYNVTTSSAQSKKKKEARETAAVIKAEQIAGNKIIYINFLDGAGWIGRQADLKEIYRCSDYVLNLRNLGLLEDIIETHIDELYGRK